MSELFANTHSHTSDPATSRAAAARYESDAATDRVWVLRALYATGEPMTGDMIAAWCVSRDMRQHHRPWNNARAIRRMAGPGELIEQGLVERLAEVRDRQSLHVLTDAGRKYIAPRFHMEQCK